MSGSSVTYTRRDPLMKRRLLTVLGLTAAALIVGQSGAWAHDGCSGSAAYCSPSPSPSVSETPSPTPTPTPTPSETPSPSPSPSDSSTPSPTPTPSPSQPTTVTVPAPTSTQECGSDLTTVSLPKVRGVVWTQQPSDGDVFIYTGEDAVTFIAVAKPGYVIEGRHRWTFTAGPVVDCPPTLPQTGGPGLWALAFALTCVGAGIAALRLSRGSHQ